MQYIIFGCGGTGRMALQFLGFNRVFCFASNHYLDAEGYERVVDGKRVVSFGEMQHLAQSDEYLIVIASEKYARQLGEQLRDAGVTRFFVFHESDVNGLPSVYPGYWLNRLYEQQDYNKVLSLCHIEKYKKIAVYGDNEYLPYIIAEITFQSGLNAIIGVVQSSGAHRVRSIGLPVVKLDEVWDEIDCLVVNVKRSEDAIHDILEEREHSFDVVDIYDVERFEPAFYHPELAKYKDIHKGERIFLVGNGPSVRIKDLETLYEHQEISFGFNQIFRIYDRTNWRPTYMGMGDPRAMADTRYDLPTLPGTKFLLDQYHHESPYVFPDVEYIHMSWQDAAPFRPAFSNDITKGVFWGHTVMYDVGLQVAAYMGAKEIYLLGVDNVYNGSHSDDINHFIKGYVKSETVKREWFAGRNSNNIGFAMRTAAYERAEQYSRQHGFRIFNATRGGKLETFERVDFDSLFQK